MPKIYKDEFIKLYDYKTKIGYDFFKEEEVIIKGDKYKFLVCNIDLDIANCALKLAKEKSKFTMTQNQASTPRDQITKVQKCMQGVLAEMFVHFLLIERYGLIILRYDLERETFLYKTDEYDLKIIINETSYEVESRSSNIHYESIINFFNCDIIIGPYGNNIKMADELADFHFRPIYTPNFVPFKEKDGKYLYNEDLFNGKIKLIITGVATKEDFLNHGYLTTLGQKGTTYNVVKANIAGDIQLMDKKFGQIIKI